MGKTDLKNQISIRWSSNDFILPPTLDGGVKLVVRLSRSSFPESGFVFYSSIGDEDLFCGDAVVKPLLDLRIGQFAGGIGRDQRSDFVSGDFLAECVADRFHGSHGIRRTGIFHGVSRLRVILL